MEGFLQLSRLIASHLKTLPLRKRTERSMAIVSALVGAVTLARIAPDSRISDSILVAKIIERWPLFKYVDGQFTPQSNPFNTKAAAEKARLKLPERERRSVAVGVIRIKR